MSALRKIERDRTMAELATVDAMLTRLTDEDALMHLTLHERRIELQQMIASLEAATDLTASVAIYFGGRPVAENKGVETEFGGCAIQLFQDIISKQYAQDVGRLSDSGIVAAKASSRMHVTDVVRGSFGFVLEEIDEQIPLVQTPLYESVDRVSQLFYAFGGDEEHFEAETERIVQRVLDAAKSFFSLLRQENETFRLVCGRTERSFDPVAIERALRRAETTSIHDEDIEIRGVLAGVLPDWHLFEYRTETDRGLVKGRVDKRIVASTLSNWNRDWTDRPSLGAFSSKQLYKSGRKVRETLTLNDIRHR